jgi:hypothetical protein
LDRNPGKKSRNDIKGGLSTHKHSQGKSEMHVVEEVGSTFSIISCKSSAASAKPAHFREMGLASYRKVNIRDIPISINKLGMVVRFYNASYTGGIGKRIAVGGHPRQKHEILSKK